MLSCRSGESGSVGHSRKDEAFPDAGGVGRPHAVRLPGPGLSILHAQHRRDALCRFDSSIITHHVCRFGLGF